MDILNQTYKRAVIGDHESGYFVEFWIDTAAIERARQELDSLNLNDRDYFIALREEYNARAIAEFDVNEESYATCRYWHSNGMLESEHVEDKDDDGNMIYFRRHDANGTPRREGRWENGMSVVVERNADGIVTREGHYADPLDQFFDDDPVFLDDTSPVSPAPRAAAVHEWDSNGALVRVVFVERDRNGNLTQRHLTHEKQLADYQDWLEGEEDITEREEDVRKKRAQIRLVHSRPD